MEWKKELFPEYHFGAFLGQGPVTAVFQVFPQNGGDPVILKVLKPDYPYPLQGLAFLEREVLLLSKFNEPGLPRLIAKSLDSACPFFVISKLDGHDLRKELSLQYALGGARTVSILRQVLFLLSRLHKEKFTHGDIKPENILINNIGVIGLVDFAFSRDLSQDYVPDSHILLGTPSYMAPELCGSSPLISPANDIFSLGVVGYELLMGELPFPKGGVSQTLARHQSDPPSRLGSRLSGVEPALAGLIGEMLQFDLKDRPSATNLLDELVEIEIGMLSKG